MCDDISAGVGWVNVRKVKFALEFLKDFPSEEGDLTVVTGLVVEESVAPDAPPGKALNFVQLDDGMRVSRPIVVAEVVVPR